MPPSRRSLSSLFGWGRARATQRPGRGLGRRLGGAQGRTWAFRALAVALPWLALAGCELGLRLAGYGHASAFLLEARINDRAVFIENRAFGRLFFPEQLARQPLPLVVSREKPARTIRVLVFGESAAEGHPAPAFGFSRILSVLLRERWAGTQFEVINTAMTAIDSHAIRLIARDCAKLRADVWVLYMGHNEVIGPFGAGTPLSAPAPSRPLIRAQMALKRWRTGQWLEHLAGKLWGRARLPGSWEGLAMFSRNQVRFNDPRMEGVYAHFRENLGDILEAGRRAGARVVVCTLASNLKDCGPFASLHRADLTARSLTGWKSDYEAGIALEQAGQWAEAAARYETAARLDDQHAELQFRWGRCCLRLGERAVARAHLARARDLDTLRFRADSRLNAILKQAAAERAGRGVCLADMETALGRQSPEGIPGEELFYEHVHLNFAGNYWLARTIAEQMAQWLPASETGRTNPAGAWLGLGECASRLAWTDWDRYQVESQMRRWLQGPPFSNQVGHLERDRRSQERLARLQQSLGPEALDRAVASHRQALRAWPADWVLREDLAKLLEEAGDLTGAAQQWQWLRDSLPHHVQPLLRLASIADRSDLGDQAEGLYRQAIELGADTSERAAAHNGLGLTLAHWGKHRAAVVEFAKALDLRPELVEARINLGLSLYALGDVAGAIKEHELALRFQPRNIPAHVNLGKLLQAENRLAQATRHFEEAVRLEPANAVAHFNLANALAAQGQPQAALAHYAEAVRLQPDAPEARLSYGTALAQLRRLEEAAREFGEALRLQPSNPEPWLQLGGILAQQGRTDEAVRHLRAALRLDPLNRQAAQALTNLFQKAASTN